MLADDIEAEQKLSSEMLTPDKRLRRSPGTAMRSPSSTLASRCNVSTVFCSLSSVEQVIVVRLVVGFLARLCKRSLNQALVSFDLVCAYFSSFLAWSLDFVFYSMHSILLNAIQLAIGFC